MSAAPLNPHEMLRAKAVLLLRREREIYDLQRERGRFEAWLAAFHRLSHDLRTTTEQELLDVWSTLLVHQLGFQIAGIYGANEPTLSFSLRRGIAHVALKPVLAVTPECLDCLENQPSGRYSEGVPSGLSTIAEQLKMQTFLWSWQRSRLQPMLLLGGFAEATGCTHRYGERDLEHFSLSCAHLRALLDNVALIRELDLERAELRQSNRQLDESLKELQATQVSLVQERAAMLQMSRRAGMTDVATGVLHNVGNVLNSINISIQVTAERLSALRIKGLSGVVELMTTWPKTADNAPSLTKVSNYLKQLAEYLESERNALSQEVTSMQHHIDHIKRIIGKQQDYAQAIGIFEICDVTQIVEDAIGLAVDTLKRHAIAVVKHHEPTPAIRVDRHKVLQILVNLLSNAAHAVRAFAAGPRQIDTYIACTSERLVITVRDNGVGISAQHQSRLFTHGFTTKEFGHGFGLHTSAIAAKEMGGELRAHSDGEHRGASFVLELPIVTSQRMEV
ncbi:MAG TPA: ATP-binding protein [Polyangiaceae bacterium]